MPYDPNNIFAKILRGEAPSLKLFEDEQTYVMMDIMPQSEGHTLILTKEPAVTLLDMSPEGAAACIRTTYKVAQAVKTALAPEGIQVVQFNGAAAGQTVPHVHFHVIPRRGGENLKMHAREMADMAELEAVAAKIRSALEQNPA